MKYSIYTIIVCIWVLGAKALTAQSSQTGFGNRMGENVDRGPSLAKVEEKAAEALEQGDEYLAMDYYSRVVAVDSTRESALRGLSIAAFRYSAYPRAKRALTQWLALSPNNAEAQLMLADISFREAKYAEAMDRWEDFQAVPQGKTPEQLAQAGKGIAAANSAIQIMNNSEFDRLAILLDSTINTEYSEYANSANDDGSFNFSAYRYPFKGDRGERYRERQLVKIVAAQPAGDSYTTTLSGINAEKKHTLHPTFAANGDMYYAEGEFLNSAEIRCDLYRRRRQGDGYGAPEKLALNVPGFTSTEPNIGRSPGSANEVLYFVSDRDNGQGGRDIWYAQIMADGTLSEAKNLTALNTNQDDVSPFYHNSTGTLYFSTDGRPTLGGFDVYESVGTEANFLSVSTLAPPVNGAANDVFFNLTPNGMMAYFSSNRFGSDNNSEEGCCYDIFQVALVKPKMVAVAFNAKTRDSLSYTRMRLYAIVDGQTRLVEEVEQVPGAYHPFSISPGIEYMVIAERDGFKPDTNRFQAPRQVWPGVMAQNLYLPPMKVDLIAKVFDTRSKEPIPGATARFVDLGPVTPGNTSAKGGGEGRVSSNDTGNDYNYDLEFNHRYMVYVSKDGYTMDSVMVTTEGLKETTTIQKDLFITRGVALDALVFDNTTGFDNDVAINGVTFQLYETPRGGTPVLVASDLRELDNNFKSLLDFGKRYTIVANKPGYSTDTVQFNVATLSKKPFELVEQKLHIFSLDLEKYLPIRLYFDNDEPIKRTMATTTDKLYSKTFFEYFPRRDTFIQVYTRGLSARDKELATNELNVFFEDSLEGEWNRLRFFTEVLFTKLRKGDRVEITIKGFASPRAGTEYNQNLTSRRIATILNHFSDYNGSLLESFVNSGQLVIKREPNGETKSKSGVNDKINDPRNSVFSPEASRERRVEIIGIEVRK
jgi:tetratricopeptide (TPR) repeat protein